MRKFTLSRAEFERLPATRVSRWAHLLDKLSESSDPHRVPLKASERNPVGREKICHQIRAAAHQRGFRLRFRTVRETLFVQYVGERE